MRRSEWLDEAERHEKKAAELLEGGDEMDEVLHDFYANRARACRFNAAYGTVEDDADVFRR